jgi:hypothetical protein
MLYHLITQQPGKDITLHVSVTNPAMVSSLFCHLLDTNSLFPTLPFHM